MITQEQVFQNHINNREALDALVERRREAEDAAIERHGIEGGLFFALLDPRVTNDPTVESIQKEIDNLLGR